MSDPAEPDDPIDRSDRRRVTAERLGVAARCERRLWLMLHGRDVEPARESALALELKARGIAHEDEVREGLGIPPDRIWRHHEPIEPAARETERRLRETRAPLYQPVLLSRDGTRAGIPDFIYWDGDEPVLHDAKLAVNLNGKPEIPLALTHYDALLEEVLGRRAARLEITNGGGEVVELRPLPASQYEAAVRRARAILDGGPEPRQLLSHSTCEGCRYYDHCWDLAEREQRLEVLPSVQRRHHEVLRGLGIHTMADLAAADPARLLAIKGLGSFGRSMVHEARAMLGGTPSWLQPPRLHPGRPRVWFDIEADPEQGDLRSSVYLWGLAVEDEAAGPAFEAIFADGEEGGEERAWRRFTERVDTLQDEHPGAVFVHYTHYEVTWVQRYLEHYGASDRFARRFPPALWDLHKHGVVPAVRLPLRSYSIKQVAPWVGFEWRNPDSGSQWSIVQYRKLKQTRDPAERARLRRELADYNEDDLLAMRAVWRWLEEHAPGS